MTYKCAEVDSLLDDFFEGRLRPDQRKRIHRHLSECDDCSQHFVVLQWLLLILRKERSYFTQARHRDEHSQRS